MMPLPFVAILGVVLTTRASLAPEILPLEYQGEQIYRTSHALIVADSTPPQGEVAFGNSAVAIAKTLVDTCGFPKGNVAILTGQSATVSNVRAEIAKLKDPKRVSRQDRVLIVIATHGLVKEKIGFFQFAGVTDNLLPMKEVADAVLTKEGIPAKHVLMLADSCHSGSMTNSEPTVGGDQAASLSDKFQRPFRGIWAAASASGRSYSDDSSQSTQMISAIISCLGKDDTYPLNVAQACDVLYRAKDFIPVTRASLSQGTYVFALKPGKLVAQADERARQDQLEKDHQAAEALSYKSSQKVLESENALDDADKSKDSKAWASAQDKYAAALIELPTGNRTKNLNKALDSLNQAMTVFTESAYPEQWAFAMFKVGAIYNYLPTGDRQSNLKQAIQYLTGALRVFNEKAFPEEWASAMNSLAVSHRNLLSGDGEANVRKAIEYYLAALRVRTEKSSPVDYATTMNNLATCYRQLKTGDTAANNKKSIECYENAIRVGRAISDTMGWTTSMMNMGVALRLMRDANADANLKKSITCLQTVTDVLDEKTHPELWSLAMGNLGDAYGDVSTGDTDASLKKSIECYQNALRVDSEKAYPDLFGTWMLGKGISYRELKGGDRVQNLKMSVEAIENSLRVRTEEIPHDRIEALLELADTLTEQKNKTRARSVLEECLALAKKINDRDSIDAATDALKKISS